MSEVPPDPRAQGMSLDAVRRGPPRRTRDQPGGWPARQPPGQLPGPRCATAPPRPADQRWRVDDVRVSPKPPPGRYRNGRHQGQPTGRLALSHRGRRVSLVDDAAVAPPEPAPRRGPTRSAGAGGCRTEPQGPPWSVGRASAPCAGPVEEAVLWRDPGEAHRSSLRVRTAPAPRRAHPGGGRRYLGRNPSGGAARRPANALGPETRGSVLGRSRPRNPARRSTPFQPPERPGGE